VEVTVDQRRKPTLRLGAWDCMHRPAEQAVTRLTLSQQRFPISVRTNPPSVAVLDQQLVPAEFIRMVVTASVDKRAILDQVKSTGEVPAGAEIR
jgi:hypothetical protein